MRSLAPEQFAKVELPEADALVRGDAILLTSLFANGLVNALKFGEHVHVTLSVVDGVASIFIDDDGPGLAEADWERVFEPFIAIATPSAAASPGTAWGSRWCGTWRRSMSAAPASLLAAAWVLACRFCFHS